MDSYCDAGDDGAAGDPTAAAQEDNDRGSARGHAEDPHGEDPHGPDPHGPDAPVSRVPNELLYADSAAILRTLFMNLSQ